MCGSQDSATPPARLLCPDLPLLTEPGSDVTLQQGDPGTQIDLGAVKVRLHVPMVVKAVADFEFSVQEPDQQEQEKEDKNHLLAN